MTDFDLVQLATPVVFIAIVAAIVIFGPCRGRMLPDEKARASRVLRTFVTFAVVGVSGACMERWLGARFGFSTWVSSGVMLAIVAVIALIGQCVRSQIDKRAVYARPDS